MQTRNPILDEFAKLTTGAMGLAQAAGDPSSCHACHGIALHEGNRTRSGGLERAPELLPGTSRSA